MTSQLIENHAVSPLQDVFQIFLQGFEVFSSPVQPIYKGYARANLEFWELASRRSRAAIELPARMSTCVSPLHVVAAYQDFLSSAARDYTEAMTRASSAISPVFAAQGLASVHAEQPSENIRPLYRDVIIVEPAAESAEPSPEVRRYERRQRAKQVA